MIKVRYVCDLCGKEYKEMDWTLEKSTVFPRDHAPSRKVVMHICDSCAKWIKKHRGRGGEENE